MPPTKLVRHMPLIPNGSNISTILRNDVRISVHQIDLCPIMSSLVLPEIILLSAIDKSNIKCQHPDLAATKIFLTKLLILYILLVHTLFLWKKVENKRYFRETHTT